MKRCARCGESKPLSAFGMDKRSKDGLNHWCKSCNNTSAKAWQERNREHVNRAAIERWRRKHPIPRTSKSCKIIKQHHEQMKDDPEHLPTAFIQKLIGKQCKCRRP